MILFLFKLSDKYKTNYGESYLIEKLSICLNQLCFLKNTDILFHSNRTTRFVLFYLFSIKYHTTLKMNKKAES